MRSASLLALFCFCAVLSAQEPDDDLPAAGLVATFRDTHGNQCRRVDEQVSFVWRDRSPDWRIGTGRFEASWKGQLLIRSAGEYRFRAFVHGKVTIKLDGAIALTAESKAPSWFVGDPIQGRPGFRDVEIEFSKSSDQAQLQLSWSGPGFPFEPIASSSFFHPRDSVEDVSLQRGRQLVKALRCAACHEIPSVPVAIPSPSLESVGGNIEPTWIVDWLSNQVAGAVEDRQMPHLELSRAEASAVAAYLVANSPAPLRTTRIEEKLANKTSDEKATQAKKSNSNAKSSSSTKKKNSKEKQKEKYVPSAAAGERLASTLGCLACHRVGDLGSRRLFGGGDLARVGEKHSPGFFKQWLIDSKTINRHNRMPQFELSSEELVDLDLFLSSLVRTGVQKTASREAPNPTARDIELGKQLIVEHQCAACHTLPSVGGARQSAAGRVARTRIVSGPNWSNSCLNESPKASERLSKQPHYRLAQTDLAAIKLFIETVCSVKQPDKPMPTGLDLIESSNCLACHPRGLGKGISETANIVAEKYASEVEHVATLIPPSLNSIGDKLHDEALKQAITRSAPPLRSWLRVRMPKYPFSPDEAHALTQWLIDTDRVADSQVADLEKLEETQLRTVGSRLVTSDGFGCTSCHAVNEVTHGASPINARGPNLGSLGKRIRPAWFYRWVANPLRIVPRVEMPSITTAVPGVLAADLDRQIHAVWDVLNLDGYNPPIPNPVRVVRKLGQPDVRERASVLTDVLRLGERQWIKPMLVGLENRQNVLVNLEDFRLDGWWIGDVARQRTSGKTWFWEAGGENLWNSEFSESEVTLIGTKEGQPVEFAPEFVGQFRAELDRWEHVGSTVKSRHRLHFALDPTEPLKLSVVNVEQEIAPFSNSRDQSTGWRRTLRFEHIPIALKLSVEIVPEVLAVASKLSTDRRRFALAGVGDKRINIASPEFTHMFDSRGNVVGSPDSNGRFELSTEYTTTLPVDSFPLIAEQPLPTVPPFDLSVVPGFKTKQLSLPNDMMPTGFAWQPDGSMIVTSLRGNVWRATDSDRDGLYDSAKSISDELAAPFGAAATDQYIEVINKYGLLRLWDDDRDGFCERTETVASGWGHTADYHDWTLGLPRTTDGGYLITISCQQDERSEAAAYLRGTVVQLSPRNPTREDPRRYSLELFSGGHRFPIGIAIDRAGEAFVSDNQGNYNPFNELNHLKRGARYGFINAHEKSPGFNPILTPPAIDIPHPWTRSVNGICFLDSPNLAAGSAFGPFEGHLIGCEYDTQRLVRMSLYRVGDTYQGTVVPFSLDMPRSGPPLLGPISCAVSPSGDLVVGNIRDSGWGAGQNTGNVVQMRFDAAALPAGIAEIRAEKNGFRVSFTKPVARERAADKRHYTISSFTRTSTPEYGGDDEQRSEESIVEVQVASDNKSAFVMLERLKPNFVYEFHLDNLTADNAQFFPSEAFTTLRVLP